MRGKFRATVDVLKSVSSSDNSVVDAGRGPEQQLAEVSKMILVMKVSKSVPRHGSQGSCW